jgi:outer membrane receptor protein involved in Fe transport
MGQFRKSTRARLMISAAVGAIAISASPAFAQEVSRIELAPQSLASALYEFGRQTGHQVIFSPELTSSKTTPGVSGNLDEQTAMAQLLAGTGLTFRREGNTFMIVQAGEGSGPQGGRAAGEVEALIVTAQKREEDIQDVPIAMSAFSQEALERSQIAGGPDLMTQVPNMTFTKTNFASYSIQIRGIGTQAISATTDPAVAVAFNNTPFVRNRFFEQEFFDLQRIEVLRGPQGTLYGRNATAGVVNIISAKPKFVFEAKASGDLGNYANRRLEGMVNIPLVEDAVAIRLAGAWTRRDGYVTNEITGAPIDGRDLWSSRVSLRFAPSDAPFDVNMIWEHFEESDDRLRSGKQLCKRHRPTEIAGIPLNLSDTEFDGEANYNQGCERVSLYSPEAFQTPNGNGLPYYGGVMGLGVPLRDINPNQISIQIGDPYLSATQSRDLRVIESTVDPEYRAKSDIFELQANFDLTDNLTLTSETSYSTDELFSKQDLNRFNTTPGAFANSHLERVNLYPDLNLLTPGPNGGGIFCDPQIGCTDRLVGVDLSTADSSQFSQELRLGSDFEGPFNFSLGANLLRYDTVDKYYVFINTLTMAGAISAFWGGEPPSWVPGVTDNRACLQGRGRTWTPPDPNEVLNVPAAGNCLYIDPNPIGSLNDRGHNYFLSLNPYRLISYAVFGEAYYELTPNLKLTGGLRWTVDKKHAPRIPSMLLASNTIGLTVDTIVEQEWREPTGRLALDWKPELAFTDETLLYASYAHGYKAGGANPPPTAVITYANVAAEGRLDNYALFPRTFEPEFVDAFELGSKNTLLDGALTLNTAAFYYDYKNYQVSEIVDRAALNRNFDVTVWGLEIEADWRPIESLKLSLKGGYEKTRIADGETAIDLMDRTAGDPNFVVSKPFPASPSNCVVPVWLATWNGDIFGGTQQIAGLCASLINGLDPVTMLPYVPNPTVRAGAGSTNLFAAWQAYPAGYWNDYPGYDPTTNNNSTGIAKDLGGNELPNAPDFTATISADYTTPLTGDWMLALHTDIHWQSESWWRVFDDHEYNRLEPYTTVNLAAIISSEESGWNIMAYIKNVMDKDAITGAFLFSDDTGLTTNVFLNEPRLYGLRVTKAWTGGALFGGFGQRHEGPYPLTLELGGQVQRHDAPYRKLEPSFASVFPASIDPMDSQNRELDWGDGREVKLSYRPAVNWSVSLGARFGETNSSEWVVKSDETEEATCNLIDRAQCVGENLHHAPLFSDADVYNHEDHTLIDFEVFRDLGIGEERGLSSRVGVGVRYAKLGSSTEAAIVGTPDWDLAPFGWTIPTGCQFYCISFPITSQHTTYEARLTGERDFDGAGPTLSWEASQALLGDTNVGRLNVEVGVTGGVLFGDQNTRIAGDELARDFDYRALAGNFLEPVDERAAEIDINRSTSVKVPVADVSLGLSYTIDRMKIGAGYRWERYFNAIDGGYDEHEDADRTIDGPYFKLTVGFGG